MPNFNAGQPPTSLFPGNSLLVFNVEQPAVPQASVAIALPQKGTTAPAISVEITFSAAPGVFSVQVQEADTYADANFITPAGAAYTISAVNASNVARTDLIPTGGSFIRVLLSSRTNAVNFTAKITRSA